jgi:hypothetical protein
MDVLQKIKDAVRLLKEAAELLEDDGLLKLDFAIKITAQLPIVEYGPITEPEEKLPPSNCGAFASGVLIKPH